AERRVVRLECRRAPAVGARAGAEVGHLRAGEVLARGVLRAVRHLGQLVDDALDALERRVDRVEALPLDHEVLVRGDARHVRFEQVQVVDDHLERVVDLVREADRHLAQGGELVVTADLAHVRGALEQLLEVDGRQTGDGSHAGPRRAIVGGGGARVKAALALALLAGCFWRTYGRLAATHAELLVAMARKHTDLVASGRLTAESMPELTYPPERAQAVARA